MWPVFKAVRCLLFVAGVVAAIVVGNLPLLYASYKFLRLESAILVNADRV